MRGCSCHTTEGFARLALLVSGEQAKILFAEAGGEHPPPPRTTKWAERWSAVEHVQPVRAKLPRRRARRARVGVLEDVPGPARGDWARRLAINQLGNGLSETDHREDALCP